MTRTYRRHTGAVVAAVAALSIVALGADPAAAAGIPSGWQQQAVGAPAAWRISQGQGQLIAIIDSGVDQNLPALAGKVIQGRDFFPERQYGDRQYWGRHGTGMATAALSIAPGARVLSVHTGAENEDPVYGAVAPIAARAKWATGLASAVRYAADQHATVISMSLGSVIQPAGLADAIEYAIGKGVPVVASAGNAAKPNDPGAAVNQDNGNPNYVSFPAQDAGVIGVGATGQDGRRAEFSTEQAYVSVAAPGMAIPELQPYTGRVSPGNGTSPACAIVAGAVALMRAANPRLAPWQILKILEQTATHKPPSGHDYQVGYGIIDASAAVQAAKNTTATAGPFVVPAAYHGPATLGESSPARLALSIAGGALMVLALAAIVINGRRNGRNRPVPAGGPPGGWRPAPGHPGPAAGHVPGPPHGHGVPPGPGHGPGSGGGPVSGRIGPAIGGVAGRGPAPGPGYAPPARPGQQPWGTGQAPPPGQEDGPGRPPTYGQGQGQS